MNDGKPSVLKRALRVFRSSLCVAAFAFAVQSHAAVTPGSRALIFVEAETVGTSASKTLPTDWTAQELAGASGRKVLQALLYQRFVSLPIPVTVPHAGPYRIWVRYHRQTPVSPQFFVLFRDEEGEELAYHTCDSHPNMPTETPYEQTKSWAGDRTGFVWESFDASFERPVAASLVFVPGGGCSVDCLLLTDDMNLNPEKLDLASLPALKAQSLLNLVLLSGVRVKAERK